MSKKTQFQIECYKSVHEMEALGKKWNDVVTLSSGEVSLTYEWYVALEESHFTGKDVFYLALRQNDLFQGVLPIYTERAKFSKLPVRKAAFISNAYCNHNDLIIRPDTQIPEVLANAMQHLDKYIGHWDVLEIDEVQADSPRMAVLERTCRDLGYPLLKHDISHSPFIPLGRDFDSVYRSLRSGDARRRIRRLEEHLRTLEGFRIQLIREPEDVQEAMEAMLKIERASWKAKDKTDIASNKHQLAFYTKLAELTAKNGWLNIALLSASVGPMTYEFNLRFGRRCSHLKGSYNSAYKDLSPSKVLKKEVLRICCEEGFEEYDYTGQEQEHKLEWTDKMRSHQHWMIFNRTWYGRLLEKTETLAKKVEKGLPSLLKKG